jgi:hypothetical protein
MTNEQNHARAAFWVLAIATIVLVVAAAIISG